MFIRFRFKYPIHIKFQDPATCLTPRVNIAMLHKFVISLSSNMFLTILEPVVLVSYKRAFHILDVDMVNEYLSIALGDDRAI